MPHFCCASKVKAYWSLALPWSLANHEALRIGFSYDQQIACRRLERFGYEDIQHYYCYAQEAQGNERLPLARIGIEVDGDDFQVRKDIHAKRAVNLSCALEGVPVTFHPYWDMNYITQTTAARVVHREDGKTDTNRISEFSYCARLELLGQERAQLEGMTRRRTLISGKDPTKYGQTTELRFGRDASFDMILGVAGEEFCRLHRSAYNRGLVLAEMYLLDYHAVIPIRPKDSPDEVAERIYVLKENLHCLRGGAAEVKAVLSARERKALFGTSAPKFHR